MKLSFKDEDFEIDWYSGTGKGGQHRNKHQNCCRVTHLSTGVKANGTGSRSREQNKLLAVNVCKARVIALFHKDTERYRATNERVRTYHAVDNRVTDHASGLVKPYKDIVVKCNLGEMIEARLLAKRPTSET